jgi:hypothetical protein
LIQLNGMVHLISFQVILMYFYVFSSSVVWMMKIGSLWTIFFCCIDFLLCLKIIRLICLTPLISIPGSATGTCSPRNRVREISKYLQECDHTYKGQLWKDDSRPQSQ